MTTDRTALEAARDALPPLPAGRYIPDTEPTFGADQMRDYAAQAVTAALSSPPVLPAEPTLETYGDQLAADLRAMWKRASPEDRPMLSAAAWCVRAYMKLRDAPVEVKRPAPVTLTARQLRNALYFIAPDFDTDEDQRDHEGCIAWVEEGSTVDDDGKPDPAGYVVWLAEYPEEGSIPLADEWAPAAPQEAAPALDDARDADLLALQQFAASVMGDWPEQGDIDGFSLHDMAVACGLLVEETIVAPCGETCSCAENGVEGETQCFRAQPVFRRAIQADARHTAAMQQEPRS